MFDSLSQRLAEAPILKKLNLLAARLMFTASRRARLYEQISLQVSNGLTIEDSVKDYLARTERRKGKTDAGAVAANAIIMGMLDGKSFAAALEGWAPSSERMVIDAGQAGGDVSKGLNLVLKGKEVNKRIRTAVFRAVAHPFVLALSCYAMVLAIGLLFIKPMSQFIPPEKWQGSAHSLYLMSLFADSIWAVIVPILFCGLVGLLFWSFPRWTGPLRARLDRYAPYSIYRLVKGIQWLQAFVSITGAGKPQPEALEMMLRYSNAWLAERIRKILRLMYGGHGFGYALFNSGFNFPSPDIVDDIMAYVGFAKFEEKIGVVADQWTEKVVSRVEAASVVMNIVFSL